MPVSGTSITCMGQLLADVIAILAEPVQYGSDTRGSVTIVSGGAAGNVASWLGHAGVDVTLISRVGSDVMGRALIADIEREGVRPRITADRHAPTGSVVVLVSQDGERSMIPDVGAGSLIGENEIAAIEPTSIFYLSGYVLLHEATRATGLAAIERARALGAKVAVDVASASPILKVGGAQVLGWLAGVECVLANDDEARALTGIDDPFAAAALLSEFHHTVVVKRGEHGAIAISDREQVSVPALPGIRVVDTVGAGDSFAAGFLPAWHSGTLTEALDAGTRVAARCVSQLGARPTPRQITAT